MTPVKPPVEPPPLEPLTEEQIERAVRHGVVSVIVSTAVVVIGAVFIILVAGAICGATLQPGGSDLEIGQDYGTVMASPDTFEELVRGIRAHEYKEMDIYSDGRVAVRPRSGADIMFTLEPGVLDRLKAEHVDYRRVDVHRKP